MIQADGPATGLERRFLRRDALPALELIEAGPAASAHPPILFVHGAFSGAWCWSERFLDRFAAQGFRVAAVSLRGHGLSDGRSALRSATLDDLVRDVADALAALPGPAFVVGHSLGGYLAQLLLGDAAMAGLVLMGSLPPDGMALLGARLAVTDVRIWAEAMLASATHSAALANRLNLEILLGEGIPPAELHRHAARMVPESPRALAEAHCPRPVWPAPWLGVPALVVNGAEDRLVWAATSWRTAWYHGADHCLVPGGGHFLMLDPGAEAVADRILGWLESRAPDRPAALPVLRG